MTCKTCNGKKAVREQLPDGSGAWSLCPDCAAQKPTVQNDEPQLLEELERLRGLIAEAESSGNQAGDTPACPWCLAVQDPDAGRVEPHRDECPAFSGPGVVR